MAEQRSGPFVSAAFFCERVLQEVDGVQSAMRIVDRVTVQQGPAGAGTSPPPPLVALQALVILKSGGFDGSGSLELVPWAPSGLKQPGINLGITFDGGADRGVSLVLPLAMPATEEGLYWFDVVFEGRLLTRIPLRIIRQSLSVTQPPTLG